MKVKLLRHLAYSKFTVEGRMIISNRGDALHGNLVNAYPLISAKLQADVVLG